MPLELGREHGFVSGRSTTLGTARRRGTRRSIRPAPPPHAVRRRHDPRELLPHRPRHHVHRRHSRDPAARVICDLGLLVERGEIRPSVLDNALQEALRRDLVDLPRVWREWQRLGGALRPGGKVIEDLLENFVPPCTRPTALPRTQLLRLLRAAGLPEPVPQYRVQLSATRAVRLDFAWPDAKVYCEFDPYKWHGGRHKYMRDTTRRLELARTSAGTACRSPTTSSTPARSLATALLRQRLARAG